MLKRNIVAIKRAACFLSDKFSQSNSFWKKALLSFISNHNQKLHGLVLFSKKIFFSSVLLQIKPKSKLSFSFKPVITLFLLAFYLFVSPHTAVKANWNEKVIPAAAITTDVIKMEIIAEKIPNFIAPVHGYISTYFSRFHPAIDIPNPLGSPVIASSDGEIVFASWTNSGHGNLVVIRHNSGFETLYAHLSMIGVKVGQKVTQGEIIGLVGSTGDSTGPHLHFEIHENGIALNPLKYITP